MKNHLVLVAVTALALAGCGKKSAEPTGQVVATVDGEEITTAELQAEMGGAMPTDPAQASQAQSAALQMIVNRKILAAAAREQKLDKLPQAVILRHRAVDNMLVTMLQQKMRTAVPAPSREEAQQYVNDHPKSFAQRQLFTVDQVIADKVPRPVLEQMAPLETMESIVALLDRNNIRHNATVGVIDSMRIDPDAAAKISALPANAVFVTPDAGGIVRINRIRETQTQPVTGDTAVQLAQQFLANQRTGKSIEQQMTALLKAGQSKVKINPAYDKAAAKK